jgi:hypothetical protein
MSPPARRAQLLDRLAVLNKELAGLEADPLLTRADAAVLRTDEVRGAVNLTADRVNLLTKLIGEAS